MSSPAETDDVVAETAFPTLRGASTGAVNFGADNVVTMADPRSVLLITAGGVDLFAVNLEQVLQSEALLHGSLDAPDAGPSGRWTFVCRAPAGALLIGASAGVTHTLLGRPLPGSVIHRLPLTAVQAAVGRDGSSGQTGEFLEGLDAGLITMAEALRSQLPPRDFAALEVGRTLSVAAGESVRIVATCGWVFVQNGSVRFGEDSDLDPLGPGELAFITDSDWMVAQKDADVRLLSSADLLGGGRLWPVLGRQGTRFLEAIDRRIARRDAQEGQQLQRRARDDEDLLGRATSALSSLMTGSQARTTAVAPVSGEAPALAAMRMACGRLGLPVKAPPSLAGVSVVDAVEAIARASDLRTRVIRLPEGWWKRDIGPLVGRRRDDTPVAFLFRRGRYEMVDAQAGTTTIVDAELVTALSPLASVVYRPLPADATRPSALLRFGLSGCRRDVASFVACGLLLAVLGLLVPILSGQVLGSFVPRGERTLIVDAGLLVIASGLVAAVFAALQNLTVLRLEGRMSGTIQAAVWDHMLALPVRFFAQYSVGDISLAATAVNAVRDALSGVATAATLALLIGAANLALLFFYSVPLALLVVAMVVVAVAVSTVAGRFQIRLQRELFDRQRKLSAKVFQLLNGMAKLRVAAAEDRAFAQWAGDFTDVRRLSVRARLIQNRVTVFNTGFASLCSVVVFVLVAEVAHLSTPAFLSFFTAYGLLLGSLLQFLGVAITVLAVVPLLESVTPITAAEREVTEDKADPGELSGAVAFNHVSFHYSADGPTIVDDVSFSIRAGEFIAIVGPTGCGKSTLVRLLLGFEQPTSGSVVYDGLDLGRIDVTAVRRQCGVVLQNGALLAGDIKANIIGNGLFTDEDAWTAARLAGFDQDIEAMPMKMYTMLSEGASTLSGGQRQRLMIARALVSRPRIVILDEATSALDNPTQAVVAESTRQLHATRLVIAHRLSTILHADRIIVLDAGRLVQQGTYEELMQDDSGMFARLVRRQIA